MTGFTLDDLALAYRKAKVDLHYSNDARPEDLLEYEENLGARLRSLLGRLNGASTGWVRDPDCASRSRSSHERSRSSERRDRRPSRSSPPTRVSSSPPDRWQPRIFSH